MWGSGLRFIGARLATLQDASCGWRSRVSGGRAGTERGAYGRKDAGGLTDGRRRYAADAASVQLSPPIGRLDGGSRRREARQEAVGLELEERFGIA